MADSQIAISAGTGTNVDTRTMAGGDHRQVIVIGDGTTNANIAPVDVTKGLAVDLTATGANTTALKVNVASGGIASGGIASGAVASGAIASGAIASGAMAAGSHAAGAGVDGWDLTEGAIADAAVTAGATGSVSAKLRSISRDVGTVSGLSTATASQATSTNALKVVLTNDSPGVTTLGQAAAASSVPVVMASDFTSTTGYMKKEDVASADGDAGVGMLVVRKATPANTSGTDGDYEFPQISAGSLWTATVATDKTLVSERVINGGSQYETVAASQSNQVMGATGAAGDYLSHVIVSPGTAACGVVTILDNATSIVAFPGGGTTALSNLIPFIIPVGIISTSGAWKITTGANVTCVGVGRFT